jgi:hypothetical protein
VRWALRRLQLNLVLVGPRARRHRCEEGPVKWQRVTIVWVQEF